MADGKPNGLASGSAGKRKRKPRGLPPGSPRAPTESANGSGEEAPERLTLRQAQLLVLGFNEFQVQLARSTAEIVSDPETGRSGALIVMVWLSLYGEQRPKDLGKLTGTNSANMARLLDRLEGAGYVERHYGKVAGDRRAIMVMITPDGEAFIAELVGVLVQHLPPVADLVAFLNRCFGTGA